MMMINWVNHKLTETIEKNTHSKSFLESMDTEISNEKASKSLRELLMIQYL